MKTFIAAIAFTAAYAAPMGADFASGLSFLAGPSSMKAAEAKRRKYIHESMVLARNRGIKVRGYFNARDVAAQAKKARDAWYKKAKAAGSLAKLTKSLHLAALSKEAALNKKREGAFTKWEIARTNHTASITRRKAAQKCFKDSVSAHARAVAAKARATKALADAWKKENAAIKRRNAARANYEKWAKAHRSAIKGRKAAGLKAANAAKASAVASKKHMESAAKHMAAVNRRAAARAAAIRAHMAV